MDAIAHFKNKFVVTRQIKMDLCVVSMWADKKYHNYSIVTETYNCYLVKHKSLIYYSRIRQNLSYIEHLKTM
jgi:hypothetical protein